MLDFLSKYANWLLAALALALWGGAFGWYFFGLAMQTWRERFDDWND